LARVQCRAPSRFARLRTKGVAPSARRLDSIGDGRVKEMNVLIDCEKLSRVRL